MKHKTDLILLALSLAVLAVGIVSYIGKKPTETIIPELTFTQWWQNEMDADILADLINEFEEKNENVKIIPKTLDYEQTRELLFSWFPDYEDPDSEEIIKAKFPGDIFALDQLWIEDLYMNGVLDQVNSPSESLLSFFYPFFYNTNILREAGFNRPPKTRTEFLDYVRAVTSEREGRYGIGFALGEANSKGIYENIYPWFWASSASLLERGRAYNDTFDFFARLAEDKLIHPRSFYMSESEKLQAFANGQIAFILASIRDIDFLRGKMGEDNFSISDIPHADNYLGKPFFAASDWSLGLFNHSEHKELAAAFISFLTEKRNILIESTNAISDDYSNLFSINEDLLNLKARELYVAGDLVRETALPRNDGLSASERDRIFREELQNLFEGKQNASETARAVSSRWDDLRNSTNY